MRFFLFRILTVLIIIYKEVRIQFSTCLSPCCDKTDFNPGSGISTCISAHSSCRQSAQITLVNSCSSFELSLYFVYKCLVLPNFYYRRDSDLGLPLTVAPWSWAS